MDELELYDVRCICGFYYPYTVSGAGTKDSKLQKTYSKSMQQLPKFARNWPRGYKIFFILNSVEHEILNAHKYKNIEKFGIFQAQLSLECFFSRS